MLESLDPDWWRGYRGCQSPKPEQDGEPVVLFRGGDTDDAIDPKRGLTLELGFPAPTAETAIAGVRAYIDTLVDACGPKQIYIRGVHFRTTSGGQPNEAWIAVARVIIIPDRTIN